MRNILGHARTLGVLALIAGPVTSVGCLQSTPDIDTNAESSASVISAGKVYEIISVNSGLAIDVVDISKDTGAAIQQWPYWASPNQQWRLQDMGDGSFEVISINSNKCMDVEGISKEGGALVHQWDCFGAANQKWRFKDVGNGAFEIISVNSGLALDVIGISKDGGARIQQWPYWGSANQQWRLEEVSGSGTTGGGTTGGGTTGGGTTGGGSFGNTTIHPDKIGFYMIPDLQDAYMANTGSPSGFCPWTQTQASLFKLKQLMPEGWIRWDNETGHYRDTPQNVETFVQCAHNADVGMIIAASAVDGYDNNWANGNRGANRSILDIANGPYLTFAHDLLTRYSNIKLVETINEADGPGWFVSDGDDAGHWDYYLDKLTAAMGGDRGRIVGPGTAFRGSKIWNDHVNRSDMQNISYHTYSGWKDLSEVAGKHVHVTEYGLDIPGEGDRDAGSVLEDLWNAEKNGKLSGSIERIYYHQLLDDGGNRGVFNQNATEGDHFAIRDWGRALMLYRALGGISTKAYTDVNNDFAAADDNQGKFGVLVWNNSGGTKGGVERGIPGTSVKPGTSLFVTRVGKGDAHVAECRAIGDQSWVGVDVRDGNVNVRFNAVEPHGAVFVSTSPCGDLAN